MLKVRNLQKSYRTECMPLDGRRISSNPLRCPVTVESRREGRTFPGGESETSLTTPVIRAKMIETLECKNRGGNDFSEKKL